MTHGAGRRVLTVAAAAVIFWSGCSNDSATSDAPPTSAETSAPTTGPGVAELSERWISAGEPGVGGRLTDVTFDPSECGVMLVGGDLLGGARSTDGGESWQQIDGLTGREVSRFTWDPDEPGVVWIATMSGPFRSTDGGKSATAQRNGMPEPTEFTYTAPIESVVFDPQRDGRLLAFGGSHRRWQTNPGAAWGVVWESLDNGSTWAQLASFDGAVILAATNSGGTWLVSVDGVGVFRSADGQNWEGPIAGLRGRTVSQFFGSGATLWAAITSDTSAGGLASSQDAGATWKIDDVGIKRVDDAADGGATSFESLAGDADGTVVYAGDVGFSTASVSARTSTSPAWQQRSTTEATAGSPFGSGLIVRAMAANPCDADQVLIGTDETLWLSADGAKTVEDVSATAQTEGSWTGRGFGGLVTTGAAFFEDGTLATTSLDGGNLMVRSTSGEWSRPLLAERPFGGGYDVDARGSAGIAVLGQVGNVDALVRTGDSGASWTDTEVATISGFPATSELPVAAAVASDGSAFVAVSGQLWRAGPLGEPWARVAVNGQVFDVAASAAEVVLSTDAGVMVTDSTGATMTPAGGPRSITGDVTLTVSDDGTIHAAVWRDDDVGLWVLPGADRSTGAWSLLNENPHIRSVAVDPNDPDHLMAVLDDRPFHDATYRVGVIESFDGGSSWTDRADGLPLERISVVAVDPTRPTRWLVGSHGSGWWESSSDTGDSKNE